MKKWLLKLGEWLAEKTIKGLRDDLRSADLQNKVLKSDISFLMSMRDSLLEKVGILNSHLDDCALETAKLRASLREKEDEIAKLKGDPRVLDYAKKLVTEADELSASGEYKRHVVYAQLIKKFPENSKRSLAFAIEKALCST